MVIDKTPECQVALRFATRRAQHTRGRVTLMCAATPGEFQQWRGVEEIMKDEAHAEAEALLHAAAKMVNELSGILPELVIPYGTVTECLAKLLKEDKDISILVLASGRRQGRSRARWSPCSPGGVQAIPVTIVPGTFTEAQIDASRL